MREHTANKYPSPEKLTCCPYCGAKEYTIVELDHENGETDLPFYVECPECHARGPVMPTMENAARYWERAIMWQLTAYRESLNERFLDDVLGGCRQ